jgi:hypothetical protein
MVPELLELSLAVDVGGPVKPFEHNGNLIGYAVFGCELSRYREIAARIEAALEIEVSSG